MKLLARIVVPELPPASQSPNSRAHWAVKARERKEYMAMVGLAALTVGVKDMKLKRARIEIELLVSVLRRRDSDNMLIRCAKPIGDALVNLGVLEDDDSSRLEWGMPWCTKDKAKAPATVIEIWDTRPGPAGM